MEFQNKPLLKHRSKSKNKINDINIHNITKERYNIFKNKIDGSFYNDIVYDKNSNYKSKSKSATKKNKHHSKVVLTKDRNYYINKNKSIDYSKICQIFGLIIDQDIKLERLKKTLALNNNFHPNNLFKYLLLNNKRNNYEDKVLTNEDFLIFLQENQKFSYDDYFSINIFIESFDLDNDKGLNNTEFCRFLLPRTNNFCRSVCTQRELKNQAQTSINLDFNKCKNIVSDNDINNNLNSQGVINKNVSLDYEVAETFSDLLCRQLNFSEKLNSTKLELYFENLNLFSLFIEIDQDKDGFINTFDLDNFINRISKVHFKKHELYTIISLFDNESKEKLNFEEFLYMMLPSVYSVQLKKKLLKEYLIKYKKYINRLEKEKLKLMLYEKKLQEKHQEKNNLMLEKHKRINSIKENNNYNSKDENHNLSKIRSNIISKEKEFNNINNTNNTHRNKEHQSISKVFPNSMNYSKNNEKNIRYSNLVSNRVSQNNNIQIHYSIPDNEQDELNDSLLNYRTTQDNHSNNKLNKKNNLRKNLFNLNKELLVILQVEQAIENSKCKLATLKYFSLSKSIAFFFNLSKKIETKGYDNSMNLTYSKYHKVLEFFELTQSFTPNEIKDFYTRIEKASFNFEVLNSQAKENRGISDKLLSFLFLPANIEYAKLMLHENIEDTNKDNVKNLNLQSDVFLMIKEILTFHLLSNKIRIKLLNELRFTQDDIEELFFKIKGMEENKYINSKNFNEYLEIYSSSLEFGVSNALDKILLFNIFDLNRAGYISKPCFYYFFSKLNN